METHKRPKQASKVIVYMQENGSITQLEALRELGCLRLASRISELKKQGYKINRRMIKVKNRSGEPCYVAEYSLAEG